MRRSAVRTLASLASLLLLPAAGCLKDPGPFRFRIQGTVLSAADSTPVAGARVSLTAPGSTVEPNELLGEATTDASGSYELTAPLPTGYALAFPGGDCSVVALFVVKEGFGVGPDASGADVRCTRSIQRVDVLMPAE